MYCTSADVDNAELTPNVTKTRLFLKAFHSFSLLCSFHTKIFLDLVLDVMYVIKGPPILIAQYIAREFPFMVIRGDIGYIGVEM